MYDNSMFNQILKFLPRHVIRDSIQKHQSDRYRKSYKTWDHLISHLAAQLLGVKSLRALTVIMNSKQHHFYHLGLSTCKFSRSTISDANRSIKADVFKDIAMSLIEGATKHKRQLKRLLTILDSSPIKVLGRGSDWAKASKSRNYNQGLKLHLQLEADNSHVEYVELSEHNVNDISVAQGLKLKGQRLYIFDKGYCDYNWWKAIADQDSWFVTRLKANAAYRVDKSYEINKNNKGIILKDQLITLTNQKPRSSKVNYLAGVPLRLVEIQHPSDPNKRFMIVSNATQASAEEIAGWYKRRWSIELLFKWLKQNLKLTSYLGEGPNAIMSQVYIAIIAFVLMRAMHQAVHLGLERLRDLANLLKAHLFSRPETEMRWQKRRRRKQQLSLQIPLEFSYAVR